MEDPDNLEEMKVVIASLYDTFIKYLNPEAIVNIGSWIDADIREEIQNQSSRETKVQSLLGWLLYDDESGSGVIHFTRALMELTHESGSLHPAIIGGDNDEKLQMSQCMSLLISIIDGSILKKLSQDDVCNILNVMLENKIITEKVCQEAKEKDSPHKCCIEMLRKLRKGKPNWPLVFFNVMERWPNSIQTHRSDPDPGQLVEISQTSSDSQLKPIENNKITNGEAYAASVTSDNEELKKAVDSFSDFSSLTEPKSMFYMPEKEKDSFPIQFLVQNKNINAELVTSDPKYDSQNKNHQLHLDLDFSDDEEEKTDEKDGTEQKTFEEDGDETKTDETGSEGAPNLNLRNYQFELAENALKGLNTIICAPTGSGKTRVATHIILNHLQQMDYDQKTRKIAFLARTVPLVMQQCKSLKKYLPKKYEITHLTGDSEDSMHLHLILPDNDVIIMTPRILENHLRKNCLPHLGEFSMLVFDECHHTRKGEPYNTLMYSYLKTKKQISEAEEGSEFKNIKLPQIVGLTASISVEKAVQDDEAVKYILQVCGNLDVDIISCVEKNEEELKQTVPVPKEILLKLRERDNEDEAVLTINRILGKLEKNIVHHAGEIKNDELNALIKKIPSDKKSQQYGQWAVKIRNVAKAFPREENRETNSSVRALVIIADYLSAYNVALELYDLVLLEHVVAFLDRSFAKFKKNANPSKSEENYYEMFTAFKDLMKNRLRTENSNLTLLKDTLSKYLIDKGNKEDKSCGIIFVRTRALTEALTSWLNSCEDKELRDLKATVFTGTAASVEQGGMTTAEQDEVIRRFKSGIVRLLVATSVGEEGIDIPECNLVIKYNHVGNEVTTVQTRGRSRKEGGMSILLAMEKIIRKERINQEKAKMMERAIKRIREMKRSKIRRMNKEHQQQIMKDEEILQIVKQQEKNMLIKKHFRMVCLLCRKVIIDSDDIKTIYQTHHVVVNRSILTQTKTLPYKGAKYFDELRIIGSVICMGEPEEGKHCYNKLGSMMVFAQIPFVVLGIKNFGFDSDGLLGLEFYNQWKKVPYAIDEINASDFERYLPAKKEVKEDESDDDEDDSDDGDDKGNKSAQKNVEPDRLSKKDVSAEHLDHSTKQINVTSVHNNGSPEGISMTNPKRLELASQNHKDEDSGMYSNSGTGTELSEQSSGSTHSSTPLKGAGAVAIVMPAEVSRKEGTHSVQPSEISSYKSNETYHRTPRMTPSQVERSVHRIGDMRFNRECDNILKNPPPLDSVVSTLCLLPVEVQPEMQCSASFNESELESNFQLNSNSEDLEAVSRNGAGNYNEPNNSAENETDAHRSSSDNNVSQVNVENRMEGQRSSSNNNEAYDNAEGMAQSLGNSHDDSTAPKEPLQARNENVARSSEESRQNVDNNDDGSVRSHTHSIQQSGLRFL